MVVVLLSIAPCAIGLVIGRPSAMDPPCISPGQRTSAAMPPGAAKAPGQTRCIADSLSGFAMTAGRQITRSDADNRFTPGWICRRDRTERTVSADGDFFDRSVW